MGALTLADDSTAAAIVGFLRSEGAASLSHARASTLLDHLVGTYTILRHWGQPDWLQHAALLHSVYGTDTYRRQLLAAPRRDDVAAVAGERAERIAYLFATTPRGPLLAGTYRWARGLPARPLDGAREVHAAEDPTRDELDALVLLHMANLAEQARAADGSPGRWLARVRDLGELLVDSDSVAPPPFVAHLAAFSPDDEALVRGAYLEASGAGDSDRADRFALAAATCSVVPEPCVWLAFLSRCRGDGVGARSWAAQAAARLGALGVAWDRRLSFDEWVTLIEGLQRSPDETAERPHDHITHPRPLFEAVVETAASEPAGAAAAASADAIVAREAAAGRRRFYRYIDQLSGDGARTSSIYPDLDSRPWHNPDGFPLARYLERNQAAIRAEILALDAARFSPESERIGRTGNWDVVFLYERGRRHDDVCAACPVTTRGIEGYPAVRTLAGLIYVSRMRPSTHIAAHRGPTNLRVRCHLGIEVPDGDCAIRVGEHTRRWQAGRCLVFDDFFEHEAWNRTGEDRIVLIVDLWHPGLSATEVRLLETLHNYAYFHGRRLSRYWAVNAAARREATGRGETLGGGPSEGSGSG